MTSRSVLQQILETLFRSEHNSSTSEQMASAFGVSNSTVLADIAELRHLGYEIESPPHRGYHLAQCPDILLAEELKARLRLRSSAHGHMNSSAGAIGREIVVYKETESTSNIIEQAALGHAEQGIVVFAETQTRGRGRRGRTWVSPAEAGLWFSVLLRPPWPPQAATRITILSAVALVEALQHVAGLTAEIKWPNDILINDKKIAGILIEMETNTDQISFVTLGIGVNVHSVEFPDPLRNIATTVQSERGHPIRRADLAVSLLESLDRLYTQAIEGDFEPITRMWVEHSSTLGKQVSILAGDRRMEGQAIALDENGSLLVRSDNGRIEPIMSGDVIVKK